jgi:glycosyltransferase involved in cell wall biosynthesis
MIKLSVVIITYNEERNIGRCLDSVKTIADEVVVVDSFSTDNTRKICEAAGAKFIQNPFQGHIHQKNFAISQATFPHQLSLDADEVLTGMLAEEIKKVKENWLYDGYRMNRLANYCGQWIRHCGWYPDPKLRLYDTRKGRWGGMDPHDKFEMQPGAISGFLKGDLLHYTYNTIEEHIAQTNKFSSIAAKALVAKGKRITLFQILVNPAVKFIRNYFLKMGFLDGYYGFFICRIAALQTFLKYFKARHLIRTQKQNPTA